MKQLYALCIAVSLLGPNLIKAQTPDWSTGIAPIIYNNCTKCHHTNGIAHYPFESYADVVRYSLVIPQYLDSGLMPPWPPDPTYRHYVGERILSRGAIDSIEAWISGGTPEGNEALAPPVPVFSNGPTLGPADMVLQIPAYASAATTTTDDYACFVIPLNIPDDKYVKGLEIVPGNPAIVHHVIVMIDTTNALTNQDCMLALANLPGANSAVTLTSWAAGMGPTVFPSGEGGLKMGERLKKGSNIMIQIHYPAGTGGEMDSTKILFYLYSDSAAQSPNPPLRPIAVSLYTMNWLLSIAPNTVQTYYATYPSAYNIPYPGATTPADYSIFAVDPHMHLVGRQMTSFGVTPTNDTIPFERVNNWQYNWQAYYFFKNMVKLPAGSIINGIATYDNTEANPYNPFYPPQTITAGENTTNEMMLIAFMMMPYEQGDENYNIDSLITLATASYPSGVNSIKADGPTGFYIYPNPAAGGQFTLTPTNLIHGATDVSITDMLGQVVRSMRYDNLNAPVNISLKGEPDGVYLVQVRQGDFTATQKLIISN